MVLPVVQIELKKTGISLGKAMQQIRDLVNMNGYGYGHAMCFMHLFIVHQPSNTIYATNKKHHFQFNADEQFLPIYQLADEKNHKIRHLEPFTEKFLKKCTLGEMVSKYMVLVESEQKLLVMRPYQIYAVNAIVDCIHQNRGNGFIWHTTGSGKTLTSFKASTLLKDNPDIEKCLFVVDRKDLDRQTREEFNKFQEGSVEENTNTETLVRRLLSTDYTDKVIVTTIQKLGLALDGSYNSHPTSSGSAQGRSPRARNYKERLEPLANKRMVFIFDECHRSQFGENHKAIKDFFPNAQLFGFTGTPIFDENSTHKIREDQYESYKTTESIFEKQLHAYTITHAIEDRNVLKFHIDYFKGKGNQNPKPGEALPSRQAGIAQQAVVEAIMDKHNAATNQRKFNAILATASINNAIEYYRLFKETQAQRQAQNPDFQPLNIACVFSPPAQLIAKNGDQQSQKNAVTSNNYRKIWPRKRKRQAKSRGEKGSLMEIIADFNQQYGTNHNINDFDIYLSGVQSRIKNQKYSNKTPHKDKIDITICGGHAAYGL